MMETEERFYKNKVDGTVISFYLDELAEDNQLRDRNFFISCEKDLFKFNKLESQAKRMNSELEEELDALYGNEYDYADIIVDIAKRAGIECRKFEADGDDCIIWSLNGDVAWEYEIEYYKALKEYRLYIISHNGEVYCGMFEDMNDKATFINACYENFKTDPIVENWEEIEDLD